MSNATREIMWNVPIEFKWIMYISFFISLIFFFYGFYLKAVQVVGKEQLPSKLKSLLKNAKSLNWKNFFETVFLQKKVFRKPQVGVFHAMLYYGFIILWIATDLVAIHYDTPFKVFQGPLYIVISFLADFAGLAIIVGIILAYRRRYILKPKHLAATEPKRELYMYGILLNLVIVGFMLEALRILGTDPETQALTHEKYWAPIGWLMAKGLQSLNISEIVLSYAFRFLWLFHALSTMFFVGSIPFTKLSHIFLAPFNSLLSNRKMAAVLKPMNFEDESAESFGLESLRQLTSKQKLDTLTCVECGRCSEVCPALNAEKILDPKLIITKARDFEKKLTVNAAQGNATSSDNFFENEIYQFNEIDACTTCGACMEECPVHIEHVPIIMELKRYKALTLGEIPQNAKVAVGKIKTNGNPWGISQDSRFDWAKGLDVPVIEEGIPVDYLYYIGCAGSYDSSNQKTVIDTVQLLRKAQVKFAVLGKQEKCNGDPIRRFGDEYSFYEIAIENIEMLNRYKFSKIITHCPHCLHTIGKEYAKFDQGSFETIHHTELLAELIKEKKLVPEKPLNTEYTYHDPCYLGRHHGEYDAPRFILESIPGLKLKEMEKSKDKAVCCGMGGGNMWYELPEGQHLSHKRLEDIHETGSQKLSTSCSFCMINFKSTKGQVPGTDDLEIEDISSILSKSIQS